MPEIIGSIQEFNRICKRKKKKRAASERKQDEGINWDSDEEEELSGMIE